MRLAIFVGFAALLLFAVAPVSNAFFINFEEGFGKNGQAIGGDYVGIYFTNSNGLDWLYGDSNTGSYNTYSVNLGMGWNTANYNHYDYCWAWLGTTGNWGRIDFEEQDGTYLQVAYCSGTALYLEAYDANDNLLDMDSGPANRRVDEGALDMGMLRVDAPPDLLIAYVKVYDTGNYFLLDHLVGDFSGVTPVQAKTWGAIKSMFK
ncbi:MAG: hypothetical protein QME66_13280 [Candidatus Eisenbacteria bacterium]|nr:hypothetical protein [Candidatus Eisenbacteria bacterium]